VGSVCLYRWPNAGIAITLTFTVSLEQFPRIALTGEPLELTGFMTLLHQNGDAYKVQSTLSGESNIGLGQPLNEPQPGIRGMSPGFISGSANLVSIAVLPASLVCDPAQLNP